MIFTRATMLGARSWAPCASGRGAVDAVAHRHLARVGLDVDVAGALLDGLDEERVDPADDLRVLVALEDVGALLAARPWPA
jgi:hypothetical protein